MTFPTAKIELHQWANTILLGIVGFFVVQTYATIKADHEKLAEHETKIAVHTEKIESQASALNIVSGSVTELRGEVNRWSRKQNGIDQ
jgi:hypothetical protein